MSAIGNLIGFVFAAAAREASAQDEVAYIRSHR